MVSRAVPGLEDAASTRAANEEGAAAVTSQAVGEEAAASTRVAREEGGGVTTKAVGEEGAVTQAVREGGMTRALAEAGGPVVPVKPNSTNLPEQQLQGLWNDMSDKDAAKAVQACAVLYGSRGAVKFLEKNLTVEKYRLQQADAQTVARLIAALDADDFETREKAEAALSKLGPSASAALEKTLQETQSAEQKMRLQRLVESARNPAALTQARRGLEVLVALRTPESRELLQKLAGGDGNEWLTQTAKQALQRAGK